MKLHPVFHVSQLKPYNPNDETLFPNRTPPPAPPIVSDTEPPYQIDEIVDHRHIRRGNRVKTQYLVTFKNQPRYEARWLDAHVVQLAASNEDVADVSGGG